MHAWISNWFYWKLHYGDNAEALSFFCTSKTQQTLTILQEKLWSLAVCPLKFKEMPFLSFLASNFGVHRNVRQVFCFEMIFPSRSWESPWVARLRHSALAHSYRTFVCSGRRAEQTKGIKDGPTGCPFLPIRNCKSHWKTSLSALTFKKYNKKVWPVKDIRQLGGIPARADTK